MTHSIGAGAVTRRALLGGLAASAATPWHAEARDEGPDDDGLAATQAIEVSARAIPHFQSNRPDVRRFGGLEFRGGLILTSPSPHFGGWSGLVMDPDGKRLLAVSDVGSWLSAGVEYGDNRAPRAVVRARIGPLRALQGRPLRDKSEQDAETVTLLDGSIERGTLLIGFERKHRIGRFEVHDGEVQPPSGYLRLPAQARRMPDNQGFEAVTVLRAGPLKGSVVALAERYTRGSGYHTGWIWVGGQPQRFELQDIDGFNVTDAAALPDGGMLVLERYFRWTAGLRMRVRRLLPAAIKPGARLAGDMVFEADMGYEIDNMEGMAVHRGPQGETVVSLISDDNFNRFLQRTVLLQFTLLE